MALKEDLEAAVKRKFAERWVTREGRSVPSEDDIQLGNDGVYIDATVLYADLSDSTKPVDDYKSEFAAEIYGTFLTVASRVIRDNGGTITAFDGDRVMAVYMGDGKEKEAIISAVRINKAMEEIVRPALLDQYPNASYVPKHTVGVDSSRILVIKDGIRGANDLIWVGRAANYAAKLCAESDEWSTRITDRVYDKLTDKEKITVDGLPAWELSYWEPGGILIYRTNCVTSGF